MRVVHQIALNARLEKLLKELGVTFCRDGNPDRFAGEPFAHLLPGIAHRFGSRKNTLMGHQPQKCDQALPWEPNAFRPIELSIQPITGDAMLREGVGMRVQ